MIENFIDGAAWGRLRFSVDNRLRGNMAVNFCI